MVAMRSSVNLHDRMFSSITSAPMRFFDTNPGGIFSISFYKIKNIFPLLNKVEDMFALCRRFEEANKDLNSNLFLKFADGIFIMGR